MSDKPDTRISITLDPDRFRFIEGYNDDTRPFVDDVVNAYNDIYQTLQRTHDMRELWASNAAVTPEGRILAVGKETESRKNRCLARLARAERDLRARIDHTEGELTKPMTERAGMGTLNDAVRAHFKGLERPEREAAMRSAFEDGDGLTLQAVLGAPYYLSGFSKIDHELFVRDYHERNNPHLVRRLDLMNRFLGEVERNTPVVLAQFDKAVGAKPDLVRSITDASDRAMASLKDQPVV